MCFVGLYIFFNLYGWHFLCFVSFFFKGKSYFFFIGATTIWCLTQIEEWAIQLIFCKVKIQPNSSWYGNTVKKNSIFIKLRSEFPFYHNCSWLFSGLYLPYTEDCNTTIIMYNFNVHPIINHFFLMPYRPPLYGYTQSTVSKYMGLQNRSVAFIES